MSDSPALIAASSSAWVLTSRIVFLLSIGLPLRALRGVVEPPPRLSAPGVRAGLVGLLHGRGFSSSEDNPRTGRPGRGNGLAFRIQAQIFGLVCLSVRWRPAP